MNAKIVDSNTAGELLRSRNIQLRAIIARFDGDVNSAIDYCRGVYLTTSGLVSEEYRGYRYELANEQFLTVGA